MPCEIDDNELAKMIAGIAPRLTEWLVGARKLDIGDAQDAVAFSVERLWADKRRALDRFVSGNLEAFLYGWLRTGSYNYFAQKELVKRKKTGSLNAKVGEDDDSAEVGDLLPDDRTGIVVMDDALDLAKLGGFLAAMDERSKKILFDGVEGVPPEDTAKEYSCEAQDILIERAALMRKLKDGMLNR